jgi:hypothetical protein
VWCNLSVFAVWQIGSRLFVPTTIAVIGGQLIFGGVLLIMENGIPIVITSIAIISAEIVVLKVNRYLAGKLGS